MENARTTYFLQKHEEKISELTSKNESLESRIAELEKQIERLDEFVVSKTALLANKIERIEKIV